MPVTGTNLTTVADTTGGTSILTASISPAANKLIMMSVVASIGTAPTPSVSVTGCNLTWVKIGDTQQGGNNTRNVTLFRAMGPAPTTGQLTITAAGTLGGCAWSVHEFSGMDTSGTDGSGAIVQSKFTTLAAGTSASVPFDTAVLAASGGFATLTHVAQELQTAGTGWSGTGTFHGAPSASINAMVGATPVPQNVLASWTTSAIAQVAAVEIKEAAATGPVVVTGAGAATATSVAAGAGGPPTLQPPTNLTATAVSATRVDLSWTAAPGAAGYRIIRNGTIIVAEQTGTTYSDTGLTASTTYNYEVRSVA